MGVKLSYAIGTCQCPTLYHRHALYNVVSMLEWRGRDAPTVGVDMPEVDRAAFGQLVKRKRQEQRLSLGRLAIRIGELSDGTYLDARAAQNIEEGKRAIEDDPELYERVVVVLGLDRDEAHAALWPLPEGITLEDIRELRRDSGRVTTRREAASRVESPDEGASAANSELNGTIIMGDRAGIAA
jgi:transcriptional regulator with XRE-family HTH domain